jgi:hypothetical protein
MTDFASFIMVAGLNALVICAGLSAVILSIVVIGAWVRLAVMWAKRALEGGGDADAG